jgi:DNA-directed RNA polymerase subunit RPC12/RpoP
MTTLHCMGCWAILAPLEDDPALICPRCGSSDLIENDGRPAFECECGERGHANAGDLCPRCGDVLGTPLDAKMIEAGHVTEPGHKGRPLS